MSQDVTVVNQENLFPGNQGPTGKPRVFVVVPTAHGICYYTTFWMCRQGPQVAVRPYLHKRGGFVEDMRQKVLNLFLDTGIEWLLMCDSDTVPSFPAMRAVGRAESVGAKVVAYPTPFIGANPGVASNIFLTAESKDEPGVMGLATVPWFDLPWDQRAPNGDYMMFEITAAGFGCTLIHRDVLVKLMELADSGALTDYPMRAIFHQGELRYGEDQSFFLRVAAALEEKVYCDLECWCSHYKIAMMSPTLAAEYWSVGRNAPDPGRIVTPAPYDPSLKPEGERAIIRPGESPLKSTQSKLILP